jgi:ABC-type antimicrobial peptide transport system permease subunit
MHLLVRTRTEASTWAPAIRAAVNASDPDQPVHRLAPLRFHAERRLRAISIVGAMAGVFAMVAAVLAAVGTYGVMAFTVSRRTREFGIRLALGAKPAHLRRLVLGLGLRQLGVGLGLGFALAYALSLPLAPLLSPGATTNPAIYIGVAVMIGGVAVAACWLPARRAARVDPMEALRGE